MLEFEEALARVLAAAPQPTSESVSLNKAAGRVLTAPIRSPIDLPIFDNSSMDGYAVRAIDVSSATPASPVGLRVAGKVAAGQVFPAEVSSGSCVRLFTGSLLPPGTDAVVLTQAQPGENVRLRGEDLRQGSQLADAGQALSAGRIGLLAAAGLARVQVGRRPLVGLLATGSELMEPGRPLEPGRIYESNSPALTPLIERAGAIPQTFPFVVDELAGTSLALAEALNQCDAIVTSGGVSVGEMDFLKRAFEQIGGSIEFWKVAIKPGRPFAFGRFGDKLLFGLPGNPVSALVTFLLLVRPALLRWQGATDVSLPTHPGVLAEPLSNQGGRRHFVRVNVDAAGKVHSTGIQASHMLCSLAAANGLVDVPADSTLPAGSAVTVLRWEY